MSAAGEILAWYEAHGGAKAWRQGTGLGIDPPFCLVEASTVLDVFQSFRIQWHVAYGKPGIADWNDARGRTYNDVVAVLKELEAKA